MLTLSTKNKNSFFNGNILGLIRIWSDKNFKVLEVLFFLRKITWIIFVFVEVFHLGYKMNLKILEIAISLKTAFFYSILRKITIERKILHPVRKNFIKKINITQAINPLVNVAYK